MCPIITAASISTVWRNRIVDAKIVRYSDGDGQNDIRGLCNASAAPS
jgi:hypothetical protein